MGMSIANFLSYSYGWHGKVSCGLGASCSCGYFCGVCRCTFAACTLWHFLLVVLWKFLDNSSCNHPCRYIIHIEP
ncbi:hypothetical protein NL676_007247 [Syzygium grande]|nr:hypothetical protein NL676_007247 [Syzygium grande]